MKAVILAGGATLCQVNIRTGLNSSMQENKG